MAVSKERDLSKEFDNLKEDLVRLQKDLANLSAASGSAASDALGSAKATLEQEAQKLLENIQQAAGGLKQEGERALHQAEKQIEDRPVSSLLTTLGIGFALGWLVSRR
jgi:ElaB/YqjD/DUF883 family membrane-anchored ribosome-binding protein